MFVPQDFDRAKICADAAMELLHSSNAFDVSASRTYFIATAFTYHARYPHNSLLKNFMHGYRAGLKSGDLDNVGWNLQMYLDFSFASGRRLDLLDLGKMSYSTISGNSSSFFF